MEKREKADPTEPTEANDPTDPIDRTDPFDPIDSTEVCDPMERTQARDRIDSRQSRDHSDQREASRVTAGWLPAASDVVTPTMVAARPVIAPGERRTRPPGRANPVNAP
jgi:hypothetical protein